MLFRSCSGSGTGFFSRMRSIRATPSSISLVFPPRNVITPHKLRSTYGTALYQETDDIYLVAEVLGHSDVNTTRKHYAAMSDTRRRQAAGKVVLRESVSHDSEDSNS